MSGKLIVLEGTDGSGKATQARMMGQRLQREGIAFREIDFPRYGNPFAEPANLYLHGALGSEPGDVNAYASSVLFAVDRFASYKEEWGTFYEQGGVVIANRYTTSNAVHQAVKCAPEERGDFLRWLDDFEHEKLGLPRPDLVLYLDMPTQRAVELLRRRESDTNTHADIHELDTQYLAACRECALQAAGLLGWKVISCVDQDGQVRSIQDIQQEVWSLTAPLL